MKVRDLATCLRSITCLVNEMNCQKLSRLGIALLAVFILAGCVTRSDAHERSLDDVPVSQREALRDGEVTVAELEAAFQRVISCMEDGGIVPHTARLRVVNNNEVITELGYSAVENGPEIEKACKAEHLDRIYDYYASANIPSRVEQQDLARKIVECAKSNGIDISNYPQEQLISIVQSNYPDIFAECMERTRTS